MDMREIMNKAKHLQGNGTWKPLSSEEYEQWRVDRKNALPGDLTGYDCPKCKNKGYIFYLRDGCHTCRECECMAIRRGVRNAENSGLGDLLKRYTLENYQTREKWQEYALSKARDYLSDPNGHWLLLSGTVGSGKSHLCTAVCGELLKAGLEVRYMLWRDDGVRLKSAVGDGEAYRALMEPLKRVRVLYIDDFLKAGRRGVTDADVNLAFELLNARYNDRGLITILSTELSVEQILDIDAAVGSRIYERSRGFYLRFEGKEKNWRLRK